MLSGIDRDAYLQECRRDARGHLDAMVPKGAREHPAYKAVLDDPRREAAGLRPAIAIAACRALGGGLAEIVPTASVFELLHDTVPAVALDPLLDNMRLLDLGRALRLLELVAAVARRTVEGQALELAWIAARRWDVTPAEYLEMIELKTAWGSFAGPLVAGAVTAGASPELIEELTAFGLDVGVALPIREDVRNLGAAALGETSGEALGEDLWEGKRTLILSLFFDAAPEAEAAEARAVLAKPRPDPRSEARDAIATPAKTAGEVRRLRELLEPAIARASVIAGELAGRASGRWQQIREALAPSVHREWIESVLHQVV